MRHLEHLKWVLQSPSLLNRKKTLFDLVQEPSPQDIEHVLSRAPENLEAAVNAGSSHFLGSYFESLWRFYLTHSQRYELITANLQIHHEGITQGEMDFLVFDTVSHKILHQEVAVKFYLGTSKGIGSTHWVGPNARDRLDLKLAHLQEKQLPFAGQPRTRDILKAQYNITALQSQVLLKGILFLPASSHSLSIAPQINPHHQGGRWCHYTQLIEILNRDLDGEYYWQELDKPDWLSSSLMRDADDLNMLTSGELKQTLESGDTRMRARLYCRFIRNNKHYAEIERIFAVPSGWPG